MPKHFSIPKFFLILWLVFSVLYVGYSQWLSFRANQLQRPYNQGLSDAVSRVIEESKTCKAFPVNVGENKVTLVNIECLKQPEAEQPKAEEMK